MAVVVVSSHDCSVGPGNRGGGWEELEPGRLVGQVLCGKWTLEAVIGSGGMSTVYAASHCRNRKRVAVKVLHPRLASQPRARKRFSREGFLANRVDHPNAVSVLDEDCDGATMFLVMELLEGETLDALWKRSGRRLPAERVLGIVDAVLDVLESAHAKGIVHRDLKPANVFLTVSGAVKVLDFGIASMQRASSADITCSNGVSILGTPHFMAPEQARGRAGQVDARTDVWALGALLFALLSGRHVHEGDSGQDVLIACATQPPPSLGAVAPELPRPVIELVDRAIAFDRDRRWDDAGAMRKALQSARASVHTESEGRLVGAQHADEVTLTDSMSTDSALVDRAGPRPTTRAWLVRWLAASLGAAFAIGAGIHGWGPPRAASPVLNAHSTPLAWQVAPSAAPVPRSPGSATAEPERDPEYSAPAEEPSIRLEKAPAGRILPVTSRTPVPRPAATAPPSSPTARILPVPSDPEVSDPRLDRW